MKISTRVDIDLNELAYSVYEGCSDEELINFILSLDDRVADVEFSKQLVVKLVQCLRNDVGSIKLKIDGEKF